MKLWIDDVRPAPNLSYRWVKSVNEAKRMIEGIEAFNKEVWDYSELVALELIDIDHDAGDYACEGGDYIKLLDWLEETGRSYPVRIHSMNPVGVQNMRAIVERNGWQEVK